MWPVGCSVSVGTHLGSAASASEPEDRWCRSGLRSWAEQVSRNEQTLIYAAAGVLVSSWPLLVRRSAIGGVVVVEVMTNVWLKKGQFAHPWGLTWLLPPLFSCGVHAAYVQKAWPLKVTPGEKARNYIKYFIFLCIAQLTQRTYKGTYCYDCVSVSLVYLATLLWTGQRWWK